MDSYNLKKKIRILYPLKEKMFLSVFLSLPFKSSLIQFVLE